MYQIITAPLWEKNGTSFKQIWLSRKEKNHCVLSLMYYLNILVFPCPKTLCTQYGRNLPLKRSAPSFENIWILFTQRSSSPSVLEIGPVVLDTKVFKVIYEFSWLFPLDHIKAWSFIWKKKRTRFTLGCFLPSSVGNGQGVLVRKMNTNMWKNYDYYEKLVKQLFDKWQVTHFDQKGLFEPSAQVS